MSESHLYKVRNVHRLRVGGKTWAEVAKETGVSIPTARKMLAEYWERRKAGTLHDDMPDKDADLYAIASINNQRYHGGN